MNPTTNACRPHRRAMDAHFAARVHPAAAEALFAHMAACASCRRRYDRHLLLAELDPRAPSDQARMAQSLGLRAEPRRRWQWMGAMTLATAACVLLLMPLRTGQFAARGGGAATNTLLIYRIHNHGTPERLPSAAHVSRGDELSFAYSNPEKLARLMIFAVDEHGRIYWFHPAWTDANANPTAIAITPAATVTELGEAVAHDFKGHLVTLYAWFTDETPTVRQVEALIAHDGMNRLNGRVLRQPLGID